jgi:hypothetical protein
MLHCNNETGFGYDASETLLELLSVPTGFLGDIPRHARRNAAMSRDDERQPWPIGMLELIMLAAIYLAPALAQKS